MDATVSVVEVRDVGPDTVAIEFETPPGFEAHPGQFVKLSGTVDGESYSRFYTLSSPDTEGTFEVTVGVDPDEAGPFSLHLVALEPGDGLDMDGPFGSQYYEGEPAVLVLAGGPGVGPAIAIGERALAEGADVSLVYRDDAPAHRERLSALRDGGADVTVATTDEEFEAGVASALADADPQPFVYGFAEFIDLATEAVEGAGGTERAAKIENFG